MKKEPCSNHRLVFGDPSRAEAKHFNLGLCKKCKWWYKVAQDRDRLPTIRQLLKRRIKPKGIKVNYNKYHGN